MTKHQLEMKFWSRTLDWILLHVWFDHEFQYIVAALVKKSREALTRIQVVMLLPVKSSLVMMKILMTLDTMEAHLMELMLIMIVVVATIFSRNERLMVSLSPRIEMSAFLFLFSFIASCSTSVRQFVCQWQKIFFRIREECYNERCQTRYGGSNRIIKINID